MDDTFGKCNCYSFALCLPYAKLASYSTGLMQVSNDPKLIMQMVRTRSGKDVYHDVPKFSTRRCGTFHPPVPPPSSPITQVSLEQLLAPLNAIMQKLVAIDERQVGQS
jgi:hypothetical protein